MLDKQAKLLAKREVLNAQLRLIKGKEKRDTKKRADRMKILAGAFLLEQAKRDSQIAAWLQRGLRDFLTRPEERALFALDDPSAAQAEPDAPSAFSEAETRMSA